MPKKQISILFNTRLVEEIDDLERVNIWTPDTLKKLTSLRTKIQTKRETVNEETSFFNDHSVCPTCTQSIEEEFRLNRIGTLNASIEKLNEGLTDLDSKIKEEEKRESQYNELSKEVTSLNNEVSQNTVRVSGLQRQCRNLESEIQRITDQLANRNSEHEKLNDFNETLQGVYEDLATKTESVQNHDFAYSLLKDGESKLKLLNSISP